MIPQPSSHRRVSLSEGRETKTLLESNAKMIDDHNTGADTPFMTLLEGIDLASLKEEWQAHGEEETIFNKIATSIFRPFNIRVYDEIVPKDIHDEEMLTNIRKAFINAQEMVLTRLEKKVKTIRHEKGTTKMNPDKTPVVLPNGQYDIYDKTCIEDVEETKEVPMYPHDRANVQTNLVKRLRMIRVLPDYEKIRADYESNTDLNRALGLIAELTRHWKFDDPAKFIARFALFASNVKAKALGYNPKWPVLLSLVGEMGTGKSWLAEKIAITCDDLFGTKSNKSSYAKLTSRFNTPMMTRGILRLEEAIGLDKAAVETMKDYITGTEVEVERKGLDPQTFPNEVSFLSTTNESVLASLSGNDKNRRVIEFQMSKIADIDEKHLLEILTEMWKAIPVKLPNEDAIKNELLLETSTLLDSTMEDVVYDIFAHHKDEVVRGQRLMKHEFKTICTQKKIQVAKVTAWCQSKGILDVKSDGHVNVLKKGLDTFLDQMDNDYAIPTNKVEDDFEELLEGC